MLYFLIEKKFFLATNPKFPSARTANGPVLAAPMPYNEELTRRAALINATRPGISASVIKEIFAAVSILKDPLCVSQ
jgi:hypothetical protein